LEVALRTIVTDRLPLALTDTQPADELRPDQKAQKQGRRHRAAGAEADIADEVENARKAELLGDQIEHDAVPFTRRPDEIPRTKPERLIAFDPLTRTTSPGPALSSSTCNEAELSATSWTATSL